MYRSALVAGFLYWDARTDDARLTLEVLRTAVLDQFTLAEFIDAGRYDRHVRRSRLAYRRRRDRLVAALGVLMWGIKIVGAAILVAATGGGIMWVTSLHH